MSTPPNNIKHIYLVSHWVLLLLAVMSFIIPAQAQQKQKSSPPPAQHHEKKKLGAASCSFAQYVGRDASAKLIVGAATRDLTDPATPAYNRGIDSFDKGQYAEAAQAFGQAITLKPGWADAHYGLAASYAEMGEPGKAVAEFAQVVKLTDWDGLKVLTYYHMGNAYIDMKRYEQAIEAYNQAIQLDSTLSKSHNNLGVAYIELSQTEEAIREFREAVRLNPKYAEAHFNLGVAYLQLGEHDETRKQQEYLRWMSSELATKLQALINK